MVSPKVEGKRLHRLLYKDYDEDYGPGVVGISGSQGSVKTGVCLDLVEKKFENNNNELIFWRETYNSPMQCQRLTEYPFKLFIEDSLTYDIIDTVNKKKIYPDITTFKNIDELYTKAEYGTCNVPFFKSKKSWTDLIQYCNSNINAAHDLQSIFIDELEGLYPAGADNQTDEKWWNWIRDSGDIIKECRKSNTGLFGNYHNENIIDHRIRGKFMFFMYGFGARYSNSSRVKQSAIDQLKLGEFWIANASRFGKIKIKKYFPPSSEKWIINKI